MNLPHACLHQIIWITLFNTKWYCILSASRFVLKKSTYQPSRFPEQKGKSYLSYSLWSFKTAHLTSLMSRIYITMLIYVMTTIMYSNCKASFVFMTWMWKYLSFCDKSRIFVFEIGYFRCKGTNQHFLR